MESQAALGLAFAVRRDGIPGDDHWALGLGCPAEASPHVAVPGVSASISISPRLVGFVLVGVAVFVVAFLGTTWAVARSRTSIGKILQLAVPERRVLAAATLCLLLQTVCQMPLMWIFGQFINVVSEHLNKEGAAGAMPMQQLGQMLLLLVGSIVSGSILGAVSTFLFSLAGERITRRLRADFFRALLIQDMAFFDMYQSGEWLNRLAADAGTVQAAASTNLALFLNSFAQFSGGVLICLATSWKLFLVIFVVMPVMAFIAIYIGRTLKRLSKQYQNSLASAGGIAGETFGSIRTIRAFAYGESKQLELYVKELDAAFLLGRRRARIGAVLSVTIGLLVQLALVGALVVGGLMVMKGLRHQEGGMQAGTLTSFIMYALWAAGAVGSLVGLYNSMSQAVGASQRVFEVIERTPAIPSTLCAAASELLSPSRCAGAVAFEGVRFAYATRQDRGEAGGTEAPARDSTSSTGVQLEARVDVLRGISFSVQPGWVVALVGPSGGGKSTVMALIMRLYDPREGIVRLDGHDLRTLDPRWVRMQMGVVSQEPVLFAKSIRENITYGLPHGAPQSAVEEAARKANAHGFISETPGGYEAMCGERGVRLSGGEKQRIAIARALLLNPRLLLMDEATSALDTESERLVQEAMDLLLQETADRPTVFMIAHRLSTVKSARCILVVKQGRVEEQGTHEELLRSGGLYAKLAMHQQLHST